MQKDVVTSIMKEYEQRCTLYSTFTQKIEKLMTELLRENGLRVHSITSRLKDEASLRNKLLSSKGKYSELSDITDISGVRIITHYADDVDAVARVIEKEFAIDRTHSVDKRALLDPDRFGYLSLHYVAKLPGARLKLTEYRRFKDCKVEIQIRSILQHTWAEIEHDLGYRSKHALPNEIRRRFSRLAGLLEMADDDFAMMRDFLIEYEKAVRQRISHAPASVSINQASLSAFVKSSARVQKLDNRIVTAAKARLVKDEGFLGEVTDMLHYVGLKTIADIDSSLREFGNTAARFAELWIGEHEQLSAGISLFYLCYALIARKGSIEQLSDYLETYTMLGPHEEGMSLAKEMISVYNQATADTA